MNETMVIWGVLAILGLALILLAVIFRPRRGKPIYFHHRHEPACRTDGCPYVKVPGTPYYRPRDKRGN